MHRTNTGRLSWGKEGGRQDWGLGQDRRKKREKKNHSAGKNRPLEKNAQKKHALVGGGDYGQLWATRGEQRKPRKRTKVRWCKLVARKRTVHKG